MKNASGSGMAATVSPSEIESPTNISGLRRRYPFLSVNPSPPKTSITALSTSEMRSSSPNSILIPGPDPLHRSVNLTIESSPATVRRYGYDVSG